MIESAVLWGSDHVDLGTIEVRPVSHRAALAISKGKEPKGYWHKDPNEDAVAAVAGNDGVLLVCADGHNGFESVRMSVEVLLDHFDRDPSAETVSERDLLAAFQETQQALLDRLREKGAKNRDSRTTLIAAIAGSRSLRWAAMGDSALFVSSPTRVWRVDRPQHRFMGWPRMTRERVGEVLQRGTADLEPGSWVALVTDGFLDFSPGAPEDAIWAATETAAGPASLARALVEQAFSENARDNVAVAVAGPTDPGA